MNKNKVLVVKDWQTTWLIRIVEPGDKYGTEMCLTNTFTEPYIEFYDTCCDHTDFGQFVSRYRRSTIMAHEGGLRIDSAVSGWNVSDKLIERVKKWLTE